MLVEVAILGPSFDHVMGGQGSLRSPAFDDQGAHLSWDERLRTQVEADDETTLAEVVNAAAEHFGISVPLGGVGPYGPQTVADLIDGIGFWREGDDDPSTYPGPFPSYFFGLDAARRARWGSASQIRVADLVRASQAGLVGFDPLRVYLKPSLPQGGEIYLAFWDHFETLFDAVWPFVEGATTLYGAGSMGAAVIRRLRNARVLKNLRQFFEGRGAGAGQVLDLLGSRPWTPAEAAAAFDCSQEDAEALLDAAGLTEVPDRGRWEPIDSKDAAFVRHFLERLADRATYGAEIEEAAEALKVGFRGALEEAARAPGLAGVPADAFGEGPLEELDTDDESASEADEQAEPDATGGLGETRSSYRLVIIGSALEDAEGKLNAAGAAGYSARWIRAWPPPDGHELLAIMVRDEWVADGSQIPDG